MITTTFSYQQSLFHVPLSTCTYSPSPAFLLLHCKQDGPSPPQLNTRSRQSELCCGRPHPASGAWLPWLLLDPSLLSCPFPLPFPTSNSSCSSHSKSLTVVLSRLCSFWPSSLHHFPVSLKEPLRQAATHACRITCPLGAQPSVCPGKLEVP